VIAYALELARRLGWDMQHLESLERGSLLHDIGKIGIGRHPAQTGRVDQRRMGESGRTVARNDVKTSLS
jgi:HD superfamily phosphodiesterase